MRRRFPVVQQANGSERNITAVLGLPDGSASVPADLDVAKAKDHATRNIEEAIASILADANIKDKAAAIARLTEQHAAEAVAASGTKKEVKVYPPVRKGSGPLMPEAGTTHFEDITTAPDMVIYRPWLSHKGKTAEDIAHHRFFYCLALGIRNQQGEVNQARCKELEALTREWYRIEAPRRGGK